jgi:phospholipase/lecithinase/hemolysin
MRRLLAQVLMLALVSMALISAAWAQRIERIAFFGDSLSDSGNNFLLTGQSTRIPFPLGPASFSYDIGGHQYSNGMVWSQYLANALHLPHSALPFLQSRNGDFTNYAMGDARSRSGAPAFPDFNLTQLVDIFLDEFHGQVPANTLVVIWIGSNDLEDALNALSTDPSGATSEFIIQEAESAIFENMQVLYRAGARMFLIANIPDLSETPYVRFLGQSDPTIPPIVSQFTNEFNVGLAAETTVFGSMPGLQYFRLFDAKALLNLAITSPGNFHLLDVTDRCTVPLVRANAICNDPDSYLFWDATHPTTAMHRAIAAIALGQLPPQRARGHR